MTNQQQPTPPLWQAMQSALVESTGTCSVDNTDRRFIELPLEGGDCAAMLRAVADAVVKASDNPETITGADIYCWLQQEAHRAEARE